MNFQIIGGFNFSKDDQITWQKAHSHKIKWNIMHLLEKTFNLQRREVMACAPTGSGKTAAFIIPILHNLKQHSTKGFRALILAPTRELAKQVH